MSSLRNLMNDIGSYEYQKDAAKRSKKPSSNGGNSTNKGTLKEADLPTKGKVRYVPPEKWNPSEPLPKKDGGYLDKYGNVWKKGPSRTAGQAFEWDVQLSKTGKAQFRKSDLIHVKSLSCEKLNM